MAKKRTLQEFVQCIGKIPLTRERAKAIAQRTKRSYYHCVHCKDWHVGSVITLKKPKGRPYVEDNDDCEFN